MYPAIIVVVLIAIPAALYFLYRRPVPKINGEARIKGLHASVQIIRDKWGVPHIYAENLDDLLCAEGYVHAQDRLWHMELNRRIGHGRLAEIFGKVAADTDRMLRVIGLARSARVDLEQADAETIGALDAYARGVNAYMQSNPLPIEFTILGYKPEPWQPVDSLVWAKYMAWGLSVNWDSEILHALLIDKVGPERAARLKAVYDPANPLVFHDHTFEEMTEHFVAQFGTASEWLQVRGITGASNNWVVSGAKSVTGKPLLANDPHLSLTIPGVWYEVHLEAGEFRVAGVSLPGVPGVVLGHNDNIAWGFTNAFPDVQDLYVEKFNPAQPNQYEYQGKWEEATLVHEEIRVKGEKEPRAVDVKITRHGPIISELFPPLSPQVTEGLALRWTGYEPNTSVRAFLRIARATNWDEFCEGVRHFTVPSQNIVYADRTGNIGYIMSGLVPIRKKGKGIVPVPGWTDEYEWTGWIPFEEMPRVFNPPQNYLATANNQVVGKEYPYFLTTETMNGFRARRIVDLLTAQEKLSAEDFARIQVDFYCAPAKPFCELVTSLAPALLESPSLGPNRAYAERAIDVLQAWNYFLTPDSVAGALYKLIEHYAMRRLFEPWFGSLTDHYLGAGFNPLILSVSAVFLDFTPMVMRDILINDESEWINLPNQARSRNEILAVALNDAITFLRQQLGDDFSQWQWGKVHTATYNHPLGAVKPLDRIFNRGPDPLGGDSNTVWQGGFPPKFPTNGAASFIPSWRMIADVSDWDASRVVTTGGQSGHPASPHYDDFIPLWRSGEYHPMLWSRTRVEANAEGQWTLTAE